MGKQGLCHKVPASSPVCVCWEVHPLKRISLHPDTMKLDTWKSVMISYYLCISWQSTWLSWLQENPPNQRLLSFSWAWVASGSSPWHGLKDPYWLLHARWSTIRNIFSHIPMYPAWIILVFKYNLSFYNYLFDLLLLLEVWHFSLKVFPILNYSGVSGAFAVIWALISLASKHH